MSTDSQGHFEFGLVSVVIPAYNAEEFIGEAIESVLAQTYRPLEIIVVDDGSTDGTLQALEPFHSDIKLLTQTNQGPSAARNYGITAAQGEFIAFLDADDLWLRHKVSSQVGLMREHKNVGLAFGDFEEFSGNDRITVSSFLATKQIARELKAVKVIPQCFQKLLESNFIPTSTVLVRKRCFQSTGRFCESLHSTEDREMWLRLAAEYEVAGTLDLLCRKRLHGTNISRDREEALRGLYTTIRRVESKYRTSAPDRVWREALARTANRLGHFLARTGRRKESRELAWESLRYRWNLEPIKILLAALLVSPLFKPSRALTRLIHRGRRESESGNF